MKILMLTPYLPFPLISGGQIRSYNLLKNLARKHKITLVSLIKHDSEKQYLPAIQKFCQHVIVCKRPEKPWTLSTIIKTGFGKYPFLVVRNFSPQAHNVVVELLKAQTFDLIHAETFYVMPHIPHTSVPILLVEQTIEYEVYQHFVETMPFIPLRVLFGLDVFKIRYWEEYFWKQARRVVAMSPSDKKVMQQRVVQLDVSIVPNGVDTDFFTFQKKSIQEKPRILFVGNFKWLQNREAVSVLIRDIWPLISKKLPTARLWIVGRFPTKKIRNLQSQRIEVADTIDDIRWAYGNSDVLLAPIYGPGGTRYKILEAMASGVPVVTTAQGIEGLGATQGETAIIKNTPQELAQATISLLTDEQAYQKLARLANNLVRKQYSWNVIAETLDTIYETVAHETTH